MEGMGTPHRRSLGGRAIEEAAVDARKLSLLTLLVVLVGGVALQPVHAQLPDPDSVVLTLDQVKQAFKVKPPPIGVGLLLYAHFPPARPFVVDGIEYGAITLDITNDGVATYNAVPASQEGSSETIAECADHTFSAAGRKWDAADVPVDYVINGSSMPDYISPEATMRSIREGHLVWTDTNWTCSDEDPINFAFNYAGTTDRGVDFDGTSIIKFGTLDQAVAVNYVYYSDLRIREADMLLNDQYRWGNKPTTRRYNVMNLVTHEAGHTIGLDDLASPHGSLTMFGLVRRSEFSKTTLGQGDVEGAQAITP